MTNFECPICNGLHEIDEYDWVQTCIGYFWLGNMENEIKKWLEKYKK